MSAIIGLNLCLFGAKGGVGTRAAKAKGYSSQWPRTLEWGLRSLLHWERSALPARGGACCSSTRPATDRIDGAS